MYNIIFPCVWEGFMQERFILPSSSPRKLGPDYFCLYNRQALANIPMHELRRGSVGLSTNTYLVPNTTCYNYIIYECEMFVQNNDCVIHDFTILESAVCLLLYNILYIRCIYIIYIQHCSIQNRVFFFNHHCIQTSVFTICNNHNTKISKISHSNGSLAKLNVHY